MPKDFSYGIVPFCIEANKGIEFLLVRHVAGHWGLPKGHKEGSETEVETAKREFMEETGITDFEVINNKNKIQQKYIAFHPEHNEVDKTVVYFPAKIFDKKINIKMIDEISDAKWFDYDSAIKIITHRDVKTILDETISFLKENGTI